MNQEIRSMRQLIIPIIIIFSSLQTWSQKLYDGTYYNQKNILAICSDSCLWADLGLGNYKVKSITEKIVGFSSNLKYADVGNVTLAINTAQNQIKCAYGNTDIINDSLNFITIKGLNNVKSLVVASSFCLALKTDGTLWVWGYNFGDKQLKRDTAFYLNSDVKQIKLIGDKLSCLGSKYNFTLLMVKTDSTLWGAGVTCSQAKLKFNFNSQNFVKLKQFSKVTKITNSLILSNNTMQSIYNDNKSVLYSIKNIFDDYYDSNGNLSYTYQCRLVKTTS